MGICNRIQSVCFFFGCSLFLLGWSACSPNNVTIDDSLEVYFDSAGVSGTYGMFYNGAGTFTLCNVKRYRDSSFTPFHSFEPVLHLIGLETGVIPNEKDGVLIDSVRQLTIGGDSALRNSIDSFYSAVARAIGMNRMQLALDTLQYGSKKIKGDIANFWNRPDFTVSPDEQLGLIKKLYFHQLPFQKRSQDIVKQLLIKENNAAYQLAYHSSQTTMANGAELSWMIGWVEENKHPYFFVMNTETKTGKSKQQSVDVLKKILLQQGFLMGKR